MEPKPRHAHDCEECVFLGHDGGYDVYACPQEGNPTIVARYGPNGDYLSGEKMVENVPEEMRERAQALFEEWTKTYKIVRFYRNFDHPDHGMIVDTGLSLAEAQEHCQRPDTKGDDWFDGYTAE